MLRAGGITYDAELSYINLSLNSDKYYTLQVAEKDDKSGYMAIFHWGRTGTKGSFQVERGTKDHVIQLFKDKFEEKSGIPVRCVCVRARVCVRVCVRVCLSPHPTPSHTHTHSHSLTLAISLAV